MELGIDPVPVLKLNLPKKVGVAAGILAVILMAYGWFFFGDVQTQIETLDGDISKQNEEILRKEASLRKKPALLRELEEVSIKEAEASKVLPQEKQIPDLLSTVSYKASIQGLKTTLFQPRPEIPSGIYATIPIDLEVHGGYHQFGQFLDDLAKLFRIVKVNEFKAIPMVANANSGNVIQLSISAKASTYRFLNAAPEPPKGGKKGKKSEKAGHKAPDQHGAAK